MTGYVLFASMIIMLLVGVPISVTLGAATLAALLTLDVPLAVIPQRSVHCAGRILHHGNTVLCPCGQLHVRGRNIPPAC